MPTLEASVVGICVVIASLFALLVTAWCLWDLCFYCKGIYHYRRHKRRRARKKAVRDQEEVRRFSLTFVPC